MHSDFLRTQTSPGVLQEKLTTMTMHEALAASPEIAAEVDKEISEGNYMP